MGNAVRAAGKPAVVYEFQGAHRVRVPVIPRFLAFLENFTRAMPALSSQDPLRTSSYSIFQVV